MRQHKNWLVLMTVLLLCVLSPLASSPNATALQTLPPNGLALNIQPSYLGPQVVLSGAVSAATDIPDVNVRVETAAGVVVFNGPATTALRPPHGDPSASWRVPLSLANGSYDATVSSLLNGTVIASESTSFVVLAAAVPPTVVVPSGATWSYYDAGDEPSQSSGGGPPAQWYEPGYPDATWQSGPAPLGYSSDQVTETSSAGLFGQRIIAQYFRHTFDHTFDPADYVTVTMRRDDGAIIYLNGTELVRSNMPVGAVNYGTPAFSASDDTVTFTFTGADFEPGENTIAVELHQHSLASSDLIFSLEIAAGLGSEPAVSNNTEGTFLLTVGDMSRCNFDGDEAVAAQMEQLFTADSGVFVALGDLAYASGSVAEFSNCYDPNFGQFRDVTWPSAGNHEHRTLPNAAGYRNYFGPAAGPTAGPTGGLWYSFDIDENWHLIALDSDCQGAEVLPGAFFGDGCAVGSDQEAWLRADLEANKDKNIIAFFHHPPYTNNHYTDHEYTWPLWRALTEYGVELTLHGHEHHYERYQPLDYWGDVAPGGTTEFIIGSGGTFPRYNVRPTEPESAFRGTFPQGTEDFGVLQLWLRETEFEWKWEPVYGLAATDSGIGQLVDPMPMATITGVVSDVTNGAGVVGVEVCAVASRTSIETCAVTDSQGEYSIGPVVSDTYTLTSPDGTDTYVPPIPSVQVSAIVNAPTSAVADFEMWPRPSLSGTVITEDTGALLAGAQVCLDALAAGTATQCTATADDGTYAFELIEPGQDYRVSFSATDHQSECYDDVAGVCSSTGTVISVGPEDIAGVDAALELNPGGISGTVTSADTGAALSGVAVCIRENGSFARNCTTTNAVGQYVVNDLDGGRYFVSFEDSTGLYFDECYDARSCSLPSFVTVTQPDFTVGINATLDSVPAGGLGDANCSVLLTAADAQFVLELGVGSRVDGGDCPIAIGEINATAGDINDDGTTDLLDALLISQCDAGMPSEWCQ